MLRCCDECLRPPGEDGTCPDHPYARLILIDEEVAASERDLLRDMRWRRWRSGALLGLGALLVVCTGAGLLLNAQLTAALLLAGFAVALFFVAAAAIFIPPVLMARYIGLRFFAQQPVWVSAVALGSGWVGLVAVAFLTGTFWLGALCSPVILWLAGLLGVELTWRKRQAARAGSAAEEVEPAQEEGAARAQRQRERLTR